MSRIEEVELTNMCMVYDGDKVLVQDRLNRLTGVEHITVSLVAFSRFACVHSCKETSLLRISRFAFQKKACEINSSTLKSKNFLKGRRRRTQ